MWYHHSGANYRIRQGIGKLVLLLVAASNPIFLPVARAQELPDLSSFGFPYSLNASEGWYLHPPSVLNENPNFSYTVSFEFYTTVESCAQKCSEESASAGGWNSNSETCFCYYEIGVACLEPCVAETGIEFSTQPYSSAPLCEKSFCDEDFFGGDFRDYCDDDIQFDAAACDARLAIIQAEEPDLSEYGYSNILNAADGWYFQPPGVDQTFSDYEGVLSVASCAAKCLEENAPAGGWNSLDRICFCYFNLDTQCLEPCVEETGIEFSTQPYSAEQYCEKSFCDEEYFYTDAQEYCDGFNFDAAVCNAKIEAMNAPKTLDFTDLGYPYVQNATEGFFFKPTPSNDDFLFYDFFLQETSCVQKCQEENAPAGSWASRTNSCWCYFALDTQCLEPCIEESGFVFNSAPFSASSYCEKSFCDADYFYNDFPDYCNDVQFDSAACDAKLAAAAPTAVPTAAPASVPTTTAPTSAPQGGMSATAVPTAAPVSVPTTTAPSSAPPGGMSASSVLGLLVCAVVMGYGDYFGVV